MKAKQQREMSKGSRGDEIPQTEMLPPKVKANDLPKPNRTPVTKLSE
jgi:hypothetical protein